MYDCPQPHYHGTCMVLTETTVVLLPVLLLYNLTYRTMVCVRYALGMRYCSVHGRLSRYSMKAWPSAVCCWCNVVRWPSSEQMYPHAHGPPGNRTPGKCQ